MKHNIRCYDDGGKTADRYTVIYMDCPAYPDDPQGMGIFECLGMNDYPFHPQGIGMHGTAQPGRHLGKRIAFEDLPKDCQRAVLQDLE